MTLPPEKIGDKGQRYIALLKDYPKPGWQIVGYSNDEIGAIRLGETLSMNPRATAYSVTDRSAMEIDEVCVRCGNLLTGTEQEFWGNSCDSCKALH